MIPDTTAQEIAALRGEIQELKGIILSLSPQDEVLTLQEAAAFLKVSEGTVRRYVDSGGIKVFRPSGKKTGGLRFRKSDLFGVTTARGRAKRKTSASIRKLL